MIISNRIKFRSIVKVKIEKFKLKLVLKYNITCFSKHYKQYLIESPILKYFCILGNN